tara:strand:+ start:345 stop:1037 length:693 start_codon:yes stop_codon:yes gene_type:complete
MATFEAQVNGLTGLGISGSSTDPSRAELTEFLKDGVLDVTAKWIALKPEDADQFTKVSAEQTSNGLDINGARILSVVREAGTDNDWRNCKYVSPSLQSKVTDSTNFNYASSYNPAYTILENGQITVFPSPGSNPNAFKVYYINNLPQDKGGASLDYSHSDIKYFADDKVHLVVKYAAIKSLEAKLAFYTIEEEDIELVQGLSVSLATLKEDYNSAFGFIAQGKQQQQAAG